MSYPIKIVCCVCGKVIGEKPGGTEPNTVSHTYCSKECAKTSLEP